MYWILFIAIAVASYIVQATLQARMNKASRIRISSGLTGREVAQKMLNDYGIGGIAVTSTPGKLTDHFDPSKKTVNLSDTVYDRSSVAAAAVAAHECGHAVQHAKGYFPVKVRTALVPIVSFASKAVTWILLAGMLLLKTFPQLMMIGIALFALTTLFSFVTLPVELNASRRALAWMTSHGIVDEYNRDMAASALRAAACTYVVAALSSLATLIYYIAIFTGGSRR